MSAEENKAFIRRYFEEFAGKEKPADRVAEYMTDEALRHHLAEFEEAFPRYDMILEDMVAEGDRVVVRFTMRGTHDGPLMGIPPTHRPVTVSGIVIYQVRNNTITNHWINTDTLGLMQQLGVVPAPNAAP